AAALRGCRLGDARAGRARRRRRPHDFGRRQRNAARAAARARRPRDDAGVDPVEDVLARLERGELGNPEAVLAYLAGDEVDLPDAELSEARRRALLLVAAGGDPHRELGVDDRAVKA